MIQIVEVCHPISEILQSDTPGLNCVQDIFQVFQHNQKYEVVHNLN
jgi:hypothetical protein